VRYRAWGTQQQQEDRSSSTPALVLIHGFGASADQWERLAGALLAQHGEPLSIYAVDILGFGVSAKPGLSYTQHLWEAMLGAFCADVVLGENGHASVVLAGNSIGGGLAAGVAANLGDASCKGLVLCNTAGVILDRNQLDTAANEALTVAERTLNVLKTNDDAALPAFEPPPGGQVLLDAFGAVIIDVLAPQIPTLLKRYYPINPDNADDALAAAILRDARDPGAANVIGSGAKLPPQRSLNEAFATFTGPILVPQGEFDNVSGPERARSRAEQLATLRDGITVRLLESGHCPHDETPDVVAAEILRWLDAEGLLQRGAGGTTVTVPTAAVVQDAAAAGAPQDQLQAAAS